MEDKIKQIALNNSEIDDLIEQILSSKTDYIKSCKGRYSFNTPIDKIMQMEMKKIISIYLAEFSEYISDDKAKLMKDTQIEIYESDELDAHGYLR